MECGATNDIHIQRTLKSGFSCAHHCVAFGAFGPSKRLRKTVLLQRTKCFACSTASFQKHTVRNCSAFKVQLKEPDLILVLYSGTYLSSSSALCSCFRLFRRRIKKIPTTMKSITANTAMMIPATAPAVIPPSLVMEFVGGLRSARKKGAATKTGAGATGAATGALVTGGETGIGAAGAKSGAGPTGGAIGASTGDATGGAVGAARGGATGGATGATGI